MIDEILGALCALDGGPRLPPGGKLMRLRSVERRAPPDSAAIRAPDNREGAAARARNRIAAPFLEKFHGLRERLPRGLDDDPNGTPAVARVYMVWHRIQYRLQDAPVQAAISDTQRAAKAGGGASLGWRRSHHPWRRHWSSRNYRRAAPDRPGYRDPGKCGCRRLGCRVPRNGWFDFRENRSTFCTI
jgi:hypothetical protein